MHSKLGAEREFVNMQKLDQVTGFSGKEGGLSPIAGGGYAFRQSSQYFSGVRPLDSFQVAPDSENCWKIVWLDIFVDWRHLCENHDLDSRAGIEASTLSILKIFVQFAAL